MGNLWSVYNDVDRPIIPIVSRMMHHGMPVSVEALALLRPRLEAAQSTAFTQCAIEGGYPFNPGSSDQTAALIHGKFGIRVKYKTDTGKPSTKEDVLAVYKADYPLAAPLIGAILEYRKFSHLIDGFVDPLSRMAVDGRIYCNLKITGTGTGRLASSDPNLQNIPVRDIEGKQLRDCFVAEDGYLLLSGDANQLELRVAAHLSQDAALLSAYNTGADLHSETAMELFGRADGIWRYIAKTTNFGVLYGISAEGLYKQLLQEAPDGDWTVPQCQVYLSRYFASHPGVVRYIESTRSFLRRNGYVEDMFGGRRSIPKVFSGSKKKVEDALREGVNTPVQGTAARIIKVMMAKVDSLLNESGWEDDGTVWPLLQIHDDLVFEVREDAISDVAEVIKEEMENALTFSVPLLVGMKAGKQWGSMKELEI